jgi:flagellar hook-associated protein FlgK
LEILIKQRLESQFELTGSVGDDLATLKAMYPQETLKAIASLLDENHGQSIYTLKDVKKALEKSSSLSGTDWKAIHKLRKSKLTLVRLKMLRV